MRAVIYCRISRDVTGEAVGVQRQERECAALAELRGLDVMDVLVDNDISAYSGKHRPAYSQLLDSIREGDVDAVIAWHPDRLHRSLRDLEEFIAAVDAKSVDVHTVTAGDVDLSTPVGRMIARQLGTFARYESEHRSERCVAAARDLARRGRWHGSLPPYGYDLERDAAGSSRKTGRLVIVASQARVIREAARRVLAGDSPDAVCRDLNARGIPSPRGGRWRGVSLRSILVSPTHAGLRDYKGLVVGPGLWDPILTMQQHTGLRARLTDNRRAKGLRHASVHLLTGGLIVCGRCGARMYRATPGPQHVAQYACLKTDNKEGCGRTYITAERAEQVVVNAVLARLGPETVGRLLANPRAYARELQRRAQIEARMTELAHMYAEGEIGRAEWTIARASLSHQLSELPTDPAHLGGLTLAEPASIDHEWRRLSVDRQRALLHLVVEVVIIRPPPGYGPKFHPERVEVRWR